MTVRRGRKPSRLTMTLLAIIGVLVVLLAVLLVPRYQDFITTVDDRHRWKEDAAPPRREVIWQPSEPVAMETAGDSAQSHIRPLVSPDGRSLYLSIRTDDGDLDIFQCTRTGDGWSTPKPVDALNTDFDDVGPTISSDGETLYLYSNRYGGFGGSDLYVSRQRGDGWSKPVNLGSNVNSSVHEYDPALSPDASRLYFSSNRIARPNAESDDQGAEQKRWATTLRHDPGDRTFDLYVADLDVASSKWLPARPLEWLNTRHHDEGAAFVSSDGAFLYFASDRPNRSAMARNFDLYRARLDHGETATSRSPENLGPSINTPGNEIEPCLVGAGFEMLFSRSGLDRVDQYSLQKSVAKEIYHDAHWKRSTLASLLIWLFRQFMDRIWLILLLLAAVTSLIWLILKIRVREVALPGFLIAALFLHFLLATGSFYVFFQQHLAKKLTELFEEEAVVATQVLNRSLDATDSDQPSFEAVSELTLPDPAQPIDFDRREVDPTQASQPIEFAPPKPVSGNVPKPSNMNEQPIIATTPVEARDVSEPRPLPRARPTQQVTAESIQLAATQPVAMPNVEPVEPNDSVDVQRQELEQIENPIARPKVEELAGESRPVASEDLSPVETQQKIEVQVADIQMRRADTAETDADDTTVNPEVVTEKIASVEQELMETPAAQNILVNRNKDVPQAIPIPEPIELAKASQNATKPVRSKDLTPIAADDEAAGAQGSVTASPLKRSRALASRTPPPMIAADSPLRRVESAVSSPRPDAISRPVDVGRQESDMFMPDVGRLSAIKLENNASPVGLATDRLNPLMVRQPLASRRSDPLGGLDRRRSARQFADTRVRLQSLLQRRKLDESTKLEVVKEFGGNDKTLETIRRGLHWIAQHQFDDGHWGLNDFHQRCKDHKKCSGHGSSKSDTAGTGLALLPLLGDGNTHQEGPYKDAVAEGINWLIKHQKKDGNLFAGGENIAFMYSHAIATIALCECYGMTGDANLREPAQRAINFIVTAQDPKSGGWRYKPREAGDTSVVGWQVMALKSGQMADLNVPNKTLAAAQRWLDSVAGDKKRVGQFAYQRNRNFNPAMTAEALLCLEYLDNDRESVRIVRGADYLLTNLPKKNRETSYYWYYGTQAMFHLQGEHWKRWNDSIHDLLVETQRKDGSAAGTWDPRDQWERSGGRIYATSLKLLMLEVYYRHLPLYQVIE